jgi:lysophospholipase L1-like esterase
MGLWTEYKKKTAVKSTDTFLVYDNAEGVMQVDGSNVKESFRDATDTTLSQADVPADAKAVGDRFAKVEKKNTEQDAALKTKAGGSGIEFFYNAAKGCLAVKVTSKEINCMAETKILNLASFEDVETLKQTTKSQGEEISQVKQDLGDTSNELYKKEEREIAVDSSDYNLLENKVAYIDTNNEVMTYENANAYVMHKNVISGEKYRIISQTHGSVNTLLYAICDSNGKVINSAKMGVSTNTYLTTDITIPDNGVEMYLNEFPTQTYPLVVNKIETINISKINGKETVNCWGDSLTRGVGVGDSYSKAFPYVLHGLLDGRKVINCGVGGENTINIASRQGGLPNIVKPFTIPANASKVEIELTNIYGDSTGILLQGGSELDPTTGKYVMTAQINPCSINGVEGTLTYENGKYYFSRSENGESVIVSRPTPLITYAMKSMRDNINIIWIGTNGGFTTSAELIECIEAMIDYMSPINKKYIVIGVHHLVSTVTETFETIEKNMSIHFGRHFINQRKYMLEYGLSDARITPTAEDITAISQGKIPPSLLYDDVHYNDKGYNIIATLASERGKELGYWQLAK